MEIIFILIVFMIGAYISYVYLNDREGFVGKIIFKEKNQNRLNNILQHI
jgi:hypothetical protein